MRGSRQRYQHGSVRKVSRSRGFPWEFRFYITAPGGNRKLRVQTFDSMRCPTERDVRIAGWILEKFRNWLGCDGDLLRLFTRDELLANITPYWMTETIYSSLRMYFEGVRAPLGMQDNERVNVPAAVAHFPGELLFPPPVWVDRGFNVEQWTEMPRGGHFAAREQPELLADDLRCFFRQFR